MLLRAPSVRRSGHRVHRTQPAKAGCARKLRPTNRGIRIAPTSRIKCQARGTPGRTRTCDMRLRRPPFCPLNYGGMRAAELPAGNEREAAVSRNHHGYALDSYAIQSGKHGQRIPPWGKQAMVSTRLRATRKRSPAGAESMLRSPFQEGAGGWQPTSRLRPVSRPRFKHAAPQFLWNNAQGEIRL